MTPTRPTAQASPAGTRRDRLHADNGAIAHRDQPDPSRSIREQRRDDHRIALRMAAHATISRNRTDQHRMGPQMERPNDSARPCHPDRAGVVGCFSPITGHAPVAAGPGTAAAHSPSRRLAATGNPSAATTSSCSSGLKPLTMMTAEGSMSRRSAAACRWRTAPVRLATTTSPRAPEMIERSDSMTSMAAEVK